MFHQILKFTMILLREMSKHKNKWKKWLKQNNWEQYKPKPRLYIEAKAYEKMNCYVQLADGEISGFGKIRTVPKAKNDWYTDEKIIVEDAKIFKQTCSAGGTTLNGESLSRFIVELARNGENPHDWRLWWHSHVDFGVMWSGTDEAAISELTGETGSELVSICINKHSDIIARRDRDNREEDLKVYILPRIDLRIYANCEREFKKKVTHHTYIPTRFQRDFRENWSERNTPKYDWQRRIPRLLEYKPLIREVKIITDKEARALGIHYDPDTGLFVRISNGQILTEKEIREIGLGKGEEDNGLHASIGNRRSKSHIIIGS